MRQAISEMTAAPCMPAAVGTAAASNSRIREFERGVHFPKDQEYEIHVRRRTPLISPIAGNLKIP